MTGFFVVPRGWMDSPVFGNPSREPLSRHAAWLWMVETAAFKPTMARIEGQTIELGRGELSVSIRDLGKAWGWAVTKVHRFVSELFQHRFIDTKKVGRQFVISICNYDQFSYHKDAENSSDETKLERSWNDPSRTRAGSSYQVSEVREEEKLSLTREPKESRATRLSDDFVVSDEWIADGEEARDNAHLPVADLHTEAIKFANHWTAKSGAAATKKDWRKTWINWCLNAKGFSNVTNGWKQSPADNLREGAARAAAAIIIRERACSDCGDDFTPSFPFLDGE